MLRALFQQTEQYWSQDSGRRCRDDILTSLQKNGQHVSDELRVQGEQRVRRYLDGFDYHHLPTLQKIPLLQKVLSPPLEDKALNQYLRQCCGLEGARTLLPGELTENFLQHGELVQSGERVKQEAAASAQETLSLLKTSSMTYDPFGKEDKGRKLHRQAIDDARIAYGADSERMKAIEETLSKNFGRRRMGGPFGAKTGEGELASSALPSHEEASTAVARLASMMGMQAAKQQLDTILRRVRFNEIRREHGLPTVPTTTNLVFAGPPGTGKTTVARLYAQAMKHAGALSKGQFVEARRSTLVGQYIGETEAKTKEVLESALGGVLFVDEAYSLFGSGIDFGARALEEIMVFMENNRDDICVIFAGYQDEVERVLNSNPGLRSRFDATVAFAPYSDDELRDILAQAGAKQPFSSVIAASTLQRVIPSYLPDRLSKDFANGRSIRSLLERACDQRNLRLDRDYLGKNIAVPREEFSALRLTDFVPVNKPEFEAESKSVNAICAAKTTGTSAWRSLLHRLFSSVWQFFVSSFSLSTP